MTRMLELSDKEFYITMIYILKMLVKNMENMQGQMDNFSTETKL